VIAGGAAAAGIVLLGWIALRPPGKQTPLPVPGERGGPVVEVLNAAGVDGLAREVTRRLRRAGIDVVSYGNAPGPTLDSTVILVRRGDSVELRPVQDALGAGRISVRPDARLLLDGSVLVGRDLAPPLQGDP
jgi:hypothetical protein